MAIVHEERPEYPNSDDDFDRNTDDRQNSSSRLPDGENIQRGIIQTAECYVGGDLDRLVEGCRKLKILPTDLNYRQDIYEWARSVRRTSASGGWIKVGKFYRDGTVRKWMDDQPTDLPLDFDRVILKALSPTPSIVILLATFTLSDNSANLLNDEINTNRYLRIKETSSGTLYESAFHRKKSSLDQERNRVISEASKWVTRTFPGTISNDFEEKILPTLEVLTTKIANPFTRLEMPTHSPTEEIFRVTEDYRSLLSIASDGDTFSASYIPGWKLSLPREGGSWTLTCAHRLSAEEQEEDHIGYGGIYTNENFIENYFGGLISRWAIMRLVSGYEETISQVRESLAGQESFEKGSLKRARGLGRRALHTETVNLLERSRKILSNTVFDATIVSKEVQKFVENDRQWSYELDEYKRSIDWGNGEVEEIFFDRDLRKSLETRTTWFSETIPVVRSELELRASIEATVANFRLQRIAMLLAAIAIAISVVAIVIQG